VVGIAGDLGIMDTTLSAWLKAAGVPLHSRTPDARTGHVQGRRGVPSGPVEHVAQDQHRTLARR